MKSTTNQRYVTTMTLVYRLRDLHRVPKKGSRQTFAYNFLKS